MIRLAFKMLKKQKKRTLLICCSVAIAIFFILAVNAVYHSYHSMQLDNAYDYGGQWDIKMVTTEQEMIRRLSMEKGISYCGILDNTYSARLDKIEEKEKAGTSVAYIDHYYLTLLGCNKNSYSVLTFQLLQGKWPEKSDEIVLPSDFEYDGQSVKDGTIAVGNNIKLEVGKRIQETGAVTQNINVMEPEVFELSYYQTYKVSGIIDYSNYTSGIYINYGITGSDGAFPEVATVYYKSKYLSFENLRKLEEDFELTFQNVTFDTNKYVEKALYVVEESDFMKSVKYGMYLFEMLIVLIGLSIVCILTLQSAKANTRQMDLIRVLGGERKHIFTIYGSQGFMIGVMSCILGSFFFQLLTYIINLLFPYIMNNTTIDEMRLTLPGWLLPITIVIILIIMPAISIITALHELVRHKNEIKQFNKKRIMSNKKRKAVIWEELDLFSLAKGNVKRAPIRNRILTTALMIALVVVSLGVPICIATYRQGVRATGISYSADYFIVKNGISHALDSLWTELPSFRSCDKIYTSNQKVMLPEGRITTNAKRCMDMVQTPVKDHIYTVSPTIISVNESFFLRLSAQNPGLPSYVEFSKSSSCFIVNKVLLPSGSIMPIIDYTVNDTINITTYGDNTTTFPLYIGGILDRGHEDLIESNADLMIYIPEDVYLNNIYSNTHTMYYIDTKPGEEKIMGEFLQSAQQKYQFYLQDNVTEYEAAKDSATIQLIVTISSMLVLLAMCGICITILMRLDMIHRTMEYAVYRALGVDRKQAFVLHFYEHLIPICYAIVGAFVINIGMMFLIMKGVFQYYQINGLTVVISSFVTCIVFLILILLNCFNLTKQQYAKNISICLQEDYRNE